MRNAGLVGMLVVAAAITSAPPVAAGAIGLAWDSVPGATGYRVYYGTQSGSYSSSRDVGQVTQVDLTGLGDCRSYYIAVKAYGPGGVESASYSAEVVGWARPQISMAPVVAQQGSQLSISLMGANFDDAALVDVVSALPTDLTGAPLVRLDSMNIVSCNEIQASLTVETATPGQRAAPVGDLDVDLSVRNPDGVFGEGTMTVAIDINPARVDVNRSNQMTKDRVDGRDLIWLTYAYGALEGQPRYSPDADLDGDGVVDGDDLAYLASDFGRCWDGSNWDTCQ